MAEQAGARRLLEPLTREPFTGQLPRMQLVWADQGYTGELGEWVTETLGWRLEVVARPSQKEHHDWPRMVATAKARLAAGASVAEAWAGLRPRAGDRDPAPPVGGGADVRLAGRRGGAALARTTSTCPRAARRWCTWR